MPPKMELPKYNQVELEMAIKCDGEAKGRAMYAMQILSDVQELVDSNPGQAAIYLNHAKMVLAPLAKRTS